MPPTYALFRSGLRNRMAAHDAAEAAKAGTLRGGSTGLFIDDSTIAGGCHRKTVLRYLGVEVPRTPEETEEWERRQLMFEGGHSNEDNWAAVLSAQSLVPGLRLMREEEWPSHWTLKHGKDDAGVEVQTEVTGRPDIIIGMDASSAVEMDLDARDGVWKRTFRPLRGLELKCTSSAYSNVDYLFAGEPKLDHLAQAAHYFMALNLTEYELWYTSRVDFHATHFLERWPAENHPFSRFVEYGWYGKAGEKQQKKPKKAQPALSGYALRFDDAGVLHYRHLTALDCGMEAPWIASAVSKDRIVDYYRYVLDTARMKDLGPRVTNLKADGTKHRYQTCDYCDLKRQCMAGEKVGFDGWVDLVRNRASAAVEASSPPPAKKQVTGRRRRASATTKG